MKLKKILETLDGLDAAIAALYQKGADNKFHLDVEDDDTGPLVRAKEHEVGLRKIAEQERDTARTELVAANEKVESLTKNQSTSVQELRKDLETQYGTQITKLNEKHEKEKGNLEASIKRIFVDNVAKGIADDISTVPELLTELLKKRLQVEMVDGEPVTRVLTADGKPSVMTPDQLKDEYFTNEKYASIMRASDASGGGASGSKKGGGAAGKKFSEWNDAERKELLNSNPTEFHRLVALEKEAVKTGVRA